MGRPAGWMRQLTGRDTMRSPKAQPTTLRLYTSTTTPRRTVYYRPTKGTPKVQEKFVTPIKAMIEENPSFGYRTVAHLLGMNKNTVQRVFQCIGVLTQ